MQWETFFDLLAPIVARVPLMTVPGNHERDWPRSGDRFGDAGVWDSGGECGVPYMRRLGMPQGPGGGEAPWYSFDHGPIHILQYSTGGAPPPAAVGGVPACGRGTRGLQMTAAADMPPLVPGTSRHEC